MDILDGFEIFIPKNADVRTIPLWSLPKAMLKGMGLPQSDREGSRNLAVSPEGTWISPAIIRKRGHPSANHAGDVALLLGRQLLTAQGPYQMPFVSANRRAYRVLGDIFPGRVSSQTGHNSPVPHGSLPHILQDAVIIYHGRIYLAIKKPKRIRSHGEMHEANPASQSRLPATSASASESQNTELLNGSRLKRKRATCKAGVTHSENEALMNKERDTSSSKAALSVPQSSTDAACPETAGTDPRGGQAAEEDASEREVEDEEEEDEDVEVEVEEEGVNKATGSGGSEMEDLDRRAAERAVQNDVMDSTVHVSCGGVDDVAAITVGRHIPSWTRGALLDLAGASTSGPQDFDFEQLAQEELIGQMRAKLREREAALNTLQSSK